MTAPANRLLDRLIARVENSDRFDRIADAAADLAAKPLAFRPLRNVLSGTAGGHPLHPAMVLAPMGSWLAASYLDVLGGKTDSANSVAAQRLIAAGLVTAAPAALTGASDWSYTTGAERRVGFAHAVGNWLAIGLYAGSWSARRQGHLTTGKYLAAGGAALLGVTGWLGGHLAYARGVGVDTTAFQVAPDEWTEVIGAGDGNSVVNIADLVLDQPTLVHADGVPVMVVLIGGADERQLLALADRCTHRGGPLHEGSYEDGCIVCPWHESRFRVSDGQVLTGPATRSQPTYEARARYGAVQVRRTGETGSLRTNPVH
ncbi:MAG: hypothetical protein JWN95_87 [Frankiales bacterium]|nr:hypothetical protein [Frankiales bacterium]